MPSREQWEAARARQSVHAAVRRFFLAQGYLEVETPLLVAAPAMEPHIRAFEVPFVPETDVGSARTLYLHSSPEYAMKRLLADPDAPPIFQLCKVFRNGEISASHNPEFTLLEFYRPRADYTVIMSELEGALAAAETALGTPAFFSKLPYERLTVRDAVKRACGLDLRDCPDAASLRRAVSALGIRLGAAPELHDEAYEDIFFRLFLEKVEPGLGLERPTYLIDYPAPLAALARLKPQDPSVAERFELYARGAELANGFSELTDAREQRQRLVSEQKLRAQLGRPVYPLDEPFLEAVGRLPPSGGVAVGMDRVLMQLLGRPRIDGVVFLPAQELM